MHTSMKQISRFIILSIVFLSCAVHQRHPKLTQMDQIAYPHPVQTISLPGNIELAYMELGSGSQTILFIHGLGSYSPAWANNVGELSKHYRCIAIDLPGYGHSAKENYPYSMRFFADVLHNFAEAKQIGKVTLAGHSMGGQIAMVAALSYPDWVDKLILIAPAGFETFNKGQKQWFRDVMSPDAVRLTTVDQIRTNLAYNFYKLPKAAQFMIDDRIAMRSASDFPGYCYAVSMSVKGMVDEPVYDHLPLIQQPSLCIFGENDNLIPNRYLNGGNTSKYAREGATRMPDCKLVMLPKTGHFAMFEAFEAVNREIIAFMDVR